jgi:integrase
MACAATMLCCTGMLISEALNIDPGDVDLQKDSSK